VDGSVETSIEVFEEGDMDGISDPIIAADADCGAATLKPTLALRI
jgi:hypothetical protein